MHERDSGLWNTGTLRCFPQYGYSEFYALDDKGRRTILVGHSGAFSANLPSQEREWLGDLEALALEQAHGEPELARAEFDLRLARSYGLPCDPELTLAALFHGAPAGAGERRLIADPALDAGIDALTRSVTAGERAARLAELECEIQARGLIVPLYIPDRLALVRRGTVELEFDPDVYRLHVRPTRS